MLSALPATDFTILVLLTAVSANETEIMHGIKSSPIKNINFFPHSSPRETE